MFSAWWPLGLPSALDPNGPTLGKVLGLSKRHTDPQFFLPQTQYDSLSLSLDSYLDTPSGPEVGNLTPKPEGL